MAKKYATPFLKWAGGKTQLLKTFRKFYPEELRAGKIEKYVEPFLGSGAVFFEIAQQYKFQSVLLSDANEELILAYRVIQRNVNKLLKFLGSYKRRYLRLGGEDRKAYFYSIRSNYNQQRVNIDYGRYSQNWIERAAQLIFLNKTCFNGLFRMNLKGEFNSPVGSYKNPKIFDEHNLRRVADLLQGATISTLHFSEVQRRVTADSFVYFDPPYRPLSKTAYFTSYSRNQFGDAEQIALAKLYTALDKKDAKLMLSNSDPKNQDPGDNFFDDLYGAYNVHRVRANRMINSNKDGRGQVNEILVLNYPTDAG